MSKIDALDTMKNAIDMNKLETPAAPSLSLCYYNGSDPAKAPATLNYRPRRVKLRWLRYRRYADAKALYRIAKNNGTMFRMGSLVEKINTHNNKVVSLSHAAGNDEPFDFVVSMQIHVIFTKPFVPKPTPVAHRKVSLHGRPPLTTCYGTTQIQHLKEHRIPYFFRLTTKMSSKPYLSGDKYHGSLRFIFVTKH